ncbi:hypothetical protein [Natrononativus amylolyticus]|uniref:hypothetical protein n=1 Tax=Natrononativus amylolyticus TaxID=2963434 RepID=UPI0020CF5B23|nr:hypothetical protein [Natrononativus amylolyticus]
MPRPPIWDHLWGYLESDTGFYYAVGVFTLFVFVLALVLLALTSPSGLGTRELVGLVVGFLLFILVYFVSMAVHRLEGGDGSRSER